MAPGREQRSDTDYKIVDGYWAPPKRKARGPTSYSHQEIYCAIGETLSVWGGVEEALTMLFRAFSNRQTMAYTDPVGLTFGTIESIPGRINAVRALSGAYFHERKKTAAQKRPLNNLLDHIRLGAMIRNEIAHGIVIESHISRITKEGQEPLRYMGLYLIAPSFVTDRNDYLLKPEPDDPMIGFSSKNVYVLSDILDFRNKFAVLSQQVREYAGRLMNDEEEQKA